MAMFGMFVLDQLFIFVRHDPLFDLELRTVRRHLRPKITALANVKTKLQKINLRALLRQLNIVKLFHLRGTEQIAHAFTQLLAPFLWIHDYSSSTISTKPAFMKTAQIGE